MGGGDDSGWGDPRHVASPLECPFLPPLLATAARNQPAKIYQQGTTERTCSRSALCTEINVCLGENNYYIHSPKQKQINREPNATEGALNQSYVIVAVRTLYSLYNQRTNHSFHCLRSFILNILANLILKQPRRRDHAALVVFKTTYLILWFHFRCAAQIL